MSQVPRRGKAAIIGGGVIGGGWAARFLLNGWDAALYDPDPHAARKLEAVLANARRSLPALYDCALPAEGRLTIAADLAEAVSGAQWIQESVPESRELKQRVLGQILAEAPASSIIASSTSGFTPSQLQEGLNDAGRILVCHPFNPVYLLPLVEVVASPAGEPAVTARAAALLESLGMRPLLLRHEIDAHIADRLLEAIWREALWLVKDGVATTEEIDEAIRLGFGLRWSQMGLFETYRIAGGEAGMRHFMAQFGPALKWPWSKLENVPELTDDLVEQIAAQSDAQSGHRTIRELERIRDDNLVGLLRALKRNGSGAGAVIARHEASLPTAPLAEQGPIQTVERQVPKIWTDYNGHLNEAHYLEVFAQASDRFLEVIGAGQDYVKAGHSYFTLDTHIRYLAEITAGERIRVTSTLIEGDGRKIKLAHRLQGGNREAAATAEQLLIHVDLMTRRSSSPEPHVLQRVLACLAASRSRPTSEDEAAALKVSAERQALSNKPATET